MAKPISMDKERVHFNLAKLKRGGENFEIVIDPDAAIDYKNKKIKDIKDVLKSEKIFSDAKKGQLASEEHQNTIFETDSAIEIAKRILDEGEIQLSQEYRNRLYEEKKKKILEVIHRNSIDPATNLPHPLTRLENAIAEVNVKIDYYKSAEDQIQEVLKQIRAVLPIKFEMRKIEVKIPPAYAAKMYGLVTGYGSISNEVWSSDGSWNVTVELPAGLQGEFFDKLNSATHGEVETKILK